MLAEFRRSRVVQVDDRARHATQGFKGAFDQVVARLRQHFDRDVIGDMAAFDQLAHEIEVGLRG